MHPRAQRTSAQPLQTFFNCNAYLIVLSRYFSSSNVHFFVHIVRFFPFVTSTIGNFYTCSYLCDNNLTSDPKPLAYLSAAFMRLFKSDTRQIHPSISQPSSSFKYTVVKSLKPFIPSYSHQAHSVTLSTIPSHPTFSFHRYRRTSL